VNAREALATAERRLTAAGVDSPRVDAELLLAHVLGTTRTGVYADLDRELDGSLEPLLSRREQREPLAYVLGEWGFRRLILKTDARALVPRPETEIVVERGLALLPDHPDRNPDPMCRHFQVLSGKSVTKHGQPLPAPLPAGHGRRLRFNCVHHN